MTDKSLQELLKQVHDTLENAGSISEADRELLRDLSSDIQARLERPGAESEEGPHPLIGRLRAAVARFEVSHPDLTATMARAAKTLGDMGI